MQRRKIVSDLLFILLKIYYGNRARIKKETNNQVQKCEFSGRKKFQM